MIAGLAILSCALAPAAPPEAKPWTGILRDDHRQPIAGAVVRLQSGGRHETATTAKDGTFAFAALAPAEYFLAVEYTLFVFPNFTTKFINFKNRIFHFF